MKEPAFHPRLRADGRLDPEPLERMGPDWLTSWMRERLSGHDPWFALDQRSDEDPEALIAGLVRDLGSGHPLVPPLGRATRALLDEATAAPSPPSYLPSLLRLCQQVALPVTGTWFTAELKALLERPEDFAVHWPEGLADEVLFAALRQSPGWPGSPARSLWQALLRRPESTTFALSALGTSLQQQVSHLAVWWQACPRDERDLELGQLVFEAVTTEGPEAARTLLAQAPSLPSDLKSAIDRQLRAHGARPAFASAGKIPNSLKDSGFRREFLLVRAA